MALELASGIAGLVGLVGLTVQSASTLYKFCRNVPKVSTEIGAVIQEIQRLGDVLDPLKLVAEQDTISMFSTKTMAVVGSLKEEIDKCGTDFKSWLGEMRDLEEQDGKRMRNLIKTLKSAMDKSRFSQMRLQISSHRGQFVVLMELLGMDLSLLSRQRIETIDTKVDNLATQVSSSHDLTTGKLKEIQTGVNLLQTSTETSHVVTMKSLEVVESTKGQLNEILLGQTLSEGLSLQQADKLDSIMASMQTLILAQTIKSRSPRTPPSPKRIRMKGSQRRKPTTDKYESATPERRSKEVPQTCLNRIVDMAIKARYRSGIHYLQPIPVPDSDYDVADTKTKLKMVRYLQGLRLLMWLLRQDNLSSSRCCYWAGREAGEGSLVHSWNSSTDINRYVSATLHTVKLRQRSTIDIICDLLGIY